LTLAVGRDLLPGSEVIVYAPNRREGYTGRQTIATRSSSTSYTYNYSGSDATGSSAWSVAFCQTRVDVGWLNWGLAAVDQRLDLIENFAVGSETAAHQLLRLDRTIALRPDIVSVLLGTNDAIAATTAAQTIADLDSIYTQLRAAGIKIIAMTPPALATGNDAANARLMTVAAWVRLQVRTYPQQMRLVDVHQLSVNPTDTAGSAASNLLWDGTHFAPTFARIVGLAFASAVEPWLRQYVPRIVSNIQNKAVDSTLGNVVPNSLMLDTDANGTADNVTLTNSGLTAMTGTVVASASGVGNVQRLACTADGVSDSGTIELASVHTQMTAGRRYRVFARVYVTAGATNLQILSLGFNMTAGGVGYFVRLLTLYTGAGSYTTLGSEVTGLLFVSDWFTCPASLTDAKVRLGSTFSGAGSATVSLGEVFTEEQF
jgi:lysophospholipase L1-like esterase